MSHELRLVAHLDASGCIGVQPYCPCGWVGEPQHASDVDRTSTAYLQHLPMDTWAPGGEPA